MKKNITLLLFLLLLQACASQSPIVKKSASIRLGMSNTELKQLMGEPQNRQFKGKNEAWQYCSTDYSGFEADHYILVWLFDGVVTEMQTYRNTQYGTCESFFRTVNWEEAPGTSIEIRQR
jgi:hypothetical protein